MEMMHLFASDSSYFSLIFTILLIFLIPIHADHLSEKCSDGLNYTLSSPFDTNLHSLLSSLSTNAASSGFYSASTGEDPNRVYGLALCRGDVSASTCQSCLEPAIDEVHELCPNRKEAIIWYKECLIHYSHRDFFGTVDITDRVLMYLTAQNETKMEDPGVNARPLMDGLLVNTPVSPMMFAVNSTSFGEWGKRYGLMQCSRDLSKDACRKCLEELMKDFEGCCVGQKGWRILAASCNIRYEAYPFYEEAGRPESARQGGRTKQLKLVIIASLSSFMGLAIVGFCIYYCLWGRKRFQKQEKDNKAEKVKEFKSGDMEVQTSTSVSITNKQTGNQEQTQDLPLIDFCTLESATNNFSDENKLGEGGFGVVYKGMLLDGKEIAVKRLSRSSVQGLEEFKNEIALIANLQHRNLVKLLYCCIEKEEKLLVYEYMPNTSLDVFLFDPIRRAQLDWTRRRHIVAGIARGLLYLHEDSRLRIIHRDLKASNVLLDNEMNPKISDFGLARIFGGSESETNTKRVVGTYGYMAPEYAMEGLFSVKSDVFSFGVILLEIVSGKKNNRFYLSENAQSLIAYAWRLWNEGRGLELLDPLLVGSYPTSEALRSIHIGLLCVQEDAADRPTMSSVVLMLGSESVSLPQPTQPAFSVGRGVVFSGQSSTGAITSSINEMTHSAINPR